jgi:hypothetical protein
MDANERKSLLGQLARYQGAVKQILLKEWDPIGVVDQLDAQDEYDSYVLQICGMLLRNESKEKLVERLWEIETVHMGLAGTATARERTIAIADRLIGLRNRSQAQ